MSVPDWRLGTDAVALAGEGVTELGGPEWRGRFERTSFGPGFHMHTGRLEIDAAFDLPVAGVDDGPNSISVFTLTSGAARLALPGWAPIELSPGRASLFCIEGRRGVFHLPGPQVLRFFSVALPPDLMVELLDGEAPASLRPLIESRGAKTVVKERAVSRATRTLIDGLGGPSEAGALHRLHREAIAIQLLAEMVEPDLESAEPTASTLSADEHAAIDAARQRLLADLSDPPPAAVLAQGAGMGLRRFLRAFEARHGASPAQLLRLERLNRARQMLEGSNASLKEIAWTVGYGHVSNFVSAFTEHFGLPPRQFQRQGDAGA